MRTIEGSGYKITYPEEIIFVFNRNTITIETDGEDYEAKFSVIKYKTYIEDGEEFTDVADTFEDVRVSHNGNVSIDVSAYMQMYFEKKERRKRIDINVEVDGETHLLEFKAVWGVINIGEEWNVPRVVKWFKNYPQTLGIYIPEGVAMQTREDGAYSDYDGDIAGFNDLNLSDLFPTAKRSAGLRVLNGVQASVFDDTFDITFGTVDAQTWLFDIDDSDSGVFLRWIDRHGWLQYWLFKEGVQSEKSKAEGEELDVAYTDERELSHYGVKRQNKSLTRSLKCGAVYLNVEDRQIVATVASSPYVDWWNGRAWIPVRINGATLQDNHNGLVDYEIEVLFPNVITQTI